MTTSRSRIEVKDWKEIREMQQRRINRWDKVLEVLTYVGLGIIGISSILCPLLSTLTGISNVTSTFGLMLIH